MKPFMFSQRLLFKTGFVCVLMLAVACTKTNSETTTKTAASAQLEETALDKVDAGACLEYTLKLCKIVGSDSSACQSVQETIQILPLTACAAGLDGLAYSEQKYVASRKVCVELAKRLCVDLGPETMSCEMVSEQIPEFTTSQCVEMLAQYDTIVEDLQTREEARKPLDADQQKLIAAPTTSSFGPEDARVTVVEFSDFQCPYCSQAASTVDAIKENFGDTVRVVFRHFPLSFHPQAHLASQAAMAAGAQGKFWEYHDLLFKNQDALERDDLDKYAKELGLKMRKFKKALDNETFKQAVDDDIEIGNQVSIRGTPSMIINGVRVPNPVDVPDVISEIEAVLASQ